MTRYDLAFAIGEVDDFYLLAAQKVLQEGTGTGARSVRRTIVGLVAAIAAIILSLTVAMAFSPEIREAVLSVIEQLFPPKEITFALEGTPTTVFHTAQGQEPTDVERGFAIYVDENGYTMAEEDGSWFVRPLPISDDGDVEQEAFYASLPPCEMEIRKEKNASLVSAANAVHADLSDDGWTVSEITDETERLFFSASGGMSWDSPQEDHIFYPCDDQHIFHVTIRCYLEATEGHGIRFWTMLGTFSVI